MKIRQHQMAWPSWLVGILLAACPAFAADADWKLVLDENFDGTELDPKIWNIETGPRKDAVNSPGAVDVKDGRLVITTFTDEKGVTHCGFVTTRRKFFITQGRAVARCRFKVQPGTQVCFWSQSQTYGRSGGPEGAAEDGVEIDIMETTGLMKGAYQYALHWGGYKPATHKTSNHKFPNPVGSTWHDYGVEWDDTGYRFTFDDKVVATDKNCPGSKAPQFLLFTSESNIKAWNGERPKKGNGSKEKSANIFEIDWVKAWERVTAAK